MHCGIIRDESLDWLPLLINVLVSSPILKAVAGGDKSNVQHSGPAEEPLNKHSVIGPPEESYNSVRMLSCSPVRALNIKPGVTFSARPSSQQGEEPHATILLAPPSFRKFTVTLLSSPVC